MILPTAPANFYVPSLSEIKDVMEAQNGGTYGQVSLITAPPADIEAAWSEVGSGNHMTEGNEVGTLVVGVAAIASISNVLAGPEETPGEIGYKIQFDAVPEIHIKIDGTGTTTAVIIGAALIVGRDTFESGTNDDVRYITKIQDLTVTDGGIITLPNWELIINYAQEPISGTGAASVLIP